MRLGLVGWVMAGVLILPVSGCGESGDPTLGHYRHADACQLYKLETVNTLSAALVGMPQPIRADPGPLPYNLSVCAMTFGSEDGLAKPAGEGGPPPPRAPNAPTTSIPALRAISITVYRYDTGEGRLTAEQTAKVKIEDMTSAEDQVIPTHSNLDELYIGTESDGAKDIDVARALVKNIVLEITYTATNKEGPEPTAYETRTGLLKLVRDAAELLPCMKAEVGEFDPNQC